MKFLEELIDNTFFELLGKLKECGAELWDIPNPHFGFYVKIPDCIRRCFFLTSSEKDVLYELISWASTSKKKDGSCKVTESHVHINTGLSLATVKNALTSLNEKGFIEKRLDYDNRNVYLIKGGNQNAYLILSEYLYWDLNKTMEHWSATLFNKSEKELFSKSKKLYSEAVRQFARTPSEYTEVIIAIKRIVAVVYEQNESSHLDDWKELFRTVDRRIVKIYESKWR